MFDDQIQNNKLQILGKLTASHVHEIRNPLSAIQLNLDYLKMLGSEIPSDAHTSINDCNEALQRIQSLIEMLLEFSRKPNAELSQDSLNQVTLDAIEIMKENARFKNVTIEKDLATDVENFRIPKNKVLQVMLNLITNGIDSCTKEGKLNIRTYKRNDNKNSFIYWEVQDNGIGISEENKQKIFKDFFTNKKNGTGLGLSVCRMLLEEYNAKLDFESELNKGSRFFIKFNHNSTGQ
ncbi:MAG: HAMP domain-containing histidine kinase [Ignavibacteriales bacterium]|nr:MAG: HAMP domain-containing histidine kinase [Ignavibacteriales bacterium]